MSRRKVDTHRQGQANPNANPKKEAFALWTGKAQLLKSATFHHHTF
jgi:hypothetical protein